MGVSWVLGLALHLVLLPNTDSHQIKCSVTLRAAGGFLDIDHLPNRPLSGTPKNYRGERSIEVDGQEVILQVSGVLWPDLMAMEIVDRVDGGEDPLVGALRVISIQNPSSSETVPFSIRDGSSEHVDISVSTQMTEETGFAFSYLANAIGTYLDAEKVMYFRAGVIPMLTQRDFLHLDIRRLVEQESGVLYSEEIDLNSFIQTILVDNQQAFDEIKKRIGFDQLRAVSYIDAEGKKNFSLLLHFEKTDYVFAYRFSAVAETKDLSQK